MKCNDVKKVKDIEFEGEGTDYKDGRSLLVRDVDQDEIIRYLMKEMEISKVRLLAKNTRGSLKSKAIMVFLMRCLCNMKCSDICRLFGNMTQSRISRLCRIGVELYEEDKKYKDIVDKFIEMHA